MAEVFRLPKLGKNMKGGLVVASYVKEGAKVGKGEVVFEIETDKATLEVESLEGGFVKKVLVDEGQAVFVGGPLFVVGNKDEAIDRGFIDDLIVELSSKQTGQVIGGFGDDVDPVGDEELLAAFLRANSESKAEGDKVSLSEFRQLTSRRLLWSKRNIPCFYLGIEADVTDLLERCGEGEGSVAVLLEDFVVRGLAVALEHYPLMTGRLCEDSIELVEDAGIAVAIEVLGAVLPVIMRDVIGKSVAEIAKCRVDLVDRAMRGELEIADIGGACITLSNGGVFGVDNHIPIVIGGQCSGLGMGRVKEKCVKLGGKIIERKKVCFSLSVDHRIANGAEAAQFLDSVKKLLENPEGL